MSSIFVSAPLDLSALFDQMGQSLYQAWRKHDFHEDAFSPIALEVCSGILEHPNVGYRDILGWLAAAKSLPYQRRLDENFGQPSVTLYWTDSFLIEALFWHTGTTAIHQHGFSGAFGVLEGSSVHATYEFSVEKKINSRIMLGSTRLLGTEILERRTVREIKRGSGLIHSLFHLDVPSVTVVVRTVEDRESGPEYAYSVPSVASDPAAFTPLLKKQIQALELLIRMGSPDIKQYVLMLTEQCDFFAAFQILRTLRLGLPRPDIYEEVLAHLRSRFPDYVDMVKPAIEEEQRRSRIADLRRIIVDPDQRFFLALLMNLSSAPSIFNLVRQRCPGVDAVKQAHEWILEIADVMPIGITFDGPLRELLYWMLQGATKDEVKKKVVSRTGAARAAEQEKNAVIAYERISDNLLLRSLFTCA
ncbi:MAG TPA: hypothetical protein VG759_05615 [Candidatus Angelobacter sp.]|nr:hypothetical protein [Candidatus Angelobacter sp.]